MGEPSNSDDVKKATDNAPGFESGAFEALENDFQEVLQELVGDKSLERFRNEYDKLHRALKKSHESEKRLIKKCRELNQEIVANAAKVQTALKLSQEDQNTIASLKREIEKAWKMVDAAHEKEGRARETIQQLKHEIQNLSRLVEQGAGLSIGQENTVNELVKVKQDLAKEKEAQAAQIQSLAKEITQYLAKLENIEGEVAAAHEEMEALKEVIHQRKLEAEKEGKKDEKLEAEVRTLREALEAKQQAIKDKVTGLARTQDGCTKLEILLREERGKTDKNGKETDALSGKTTKLIRECEEAQHALQQMVTEGAQRQVELKLCQEEKVRTEAELKRILKTAEVAEKALEAKRKELLADEKDRDAAKLEIIALDEKLEAAKEAHEKERRELDDLLRERDLQNKKLILASGVTAKQMDQVLMCENTRRNLELEISGFKTEAHMQRKQLYLLEKEGEKYGAEAAEARGKYNQALDEVRVREMSIIQLQKRIAEGEAKLKQQQALYEAVRSDRNLYSKNLVESQDEIAEMKRKFKIMNHQIEQLKEEIHIKDQNLVREHFDRMKVEKEKELLRDHLGKLRTREQQSEDYVAQMLAETTKLNTIINEADKEHQRQRKECEVVVNERDILGTQLIRRNEELSLLYEKIRIQQSNLQKGEQQYKVRVKDIRALKRRIRELGGQLGGVASQKGSVETLRNEVYQLQRELLHERTKVRALSEELENPMNVHRWRKLEGSDPATYELVQKTHMLQKRLIEKSEEVLDKDLLIRHKEKLYLELKNILARQPGPEVAEQLSTFQASLVERAKQMEQLEAELSMSHTQASEYKYEIARISKELQEVKKKFYDQRKREQHAAEVRRAERAIPTELLVQEARSTLNRFTGGGFNLNMPGT
jgi:chromosome segregation ATPase